VDETEPEIQETRNSPFGCGGGILRHCLVLNQIEGGGGAGHGIGDEKSEALGPEGTAGGEMRGNSASEWCARIGAGQAPHGHLLLPLHGLVEYHQPVFPSPISTISNRQFCWTPPGDAVHPDSRRP
jgi:hypothetical protein